MAPPLLSDLSSLVNSNPASGLEERINKLEDKSIETMQAEEQRGKKYTKTPVVEVPEKK